MQIKASWFARNSIGCSTASSGLQQIKYLYPQNGYLRGEPSVTGGFPSQRASKAVPCHDTIMNYLGDRVQSDLPYQTVD